MSDWIWSAHLNPEPFPNHLARFFLHTPGVFEQQLQYSTTLIFDQPSFRNGIQVCGFLDRTTRELVISYIAQRRRAWYSMTHHAVLGRLTTIQCGMSDIEFGAKWSNLLDFDSRPDLFSPLETQVLEFAAAFATNPKSYSDDQYRSLRQVVAASLESRYQLESSWLANLEAARIARSRGVAAGETGEELDRRVTEATSAPSSAVAAGALERSVDAAIVELGFLCLQFVALSCVFSGLNIPDEAFLPDVMTSLLPDELIEKLNDLCALGGAGLVGLAPPQVDVDVSPIAAGKIKVSPAALSRCRVPMRGYEVGYEDRDKGLTVGGVQVGVYGWGFGAHFPGSLAYLLMHHPELARFEAPYSLPLLFNEDEWRNGVQTSGFVPRLLKEIVIQKVYQANRSRYGLEHHTMFLFNAVIDEFGAGRRPALEGADKSSARLKAVQRAEAIVLYAAAPDSAPNGTFSPVEKAAMAWAERLVTAPHRAHELEGTVRELLSEENRREVARGDRRLDQSGDVGEEYAFARLLDHQIAELAMLVGHMDGLGRLLTILQLPAELGVDARDGYFQDRPGLHDAMRAIGVTEAAITANELLVNPTLAKALHGATKAKSISPAEAAKTGEY